MTEQENESAFAFEGRWQEYAPIAFSNLLLTIVTLGIYRFWGTARSRQYLWTQTRFIDDHLEWTGTGMELFKGALIAFGVFIIPYFGLNMAAQSLMLRGNYIGGGLLFLVMFVLVFYLIGVAQFRGLRYRLTRTYWRGIRGGTDEPGLKYGLSYLGKSSLGYLSLGLLLPWSMVELWNERWNKMSFGPFRFEASGKVEGLMRRFLLFYLSPFLGAIAMLAFIAPMFAFFGLPDLEHGKNLPIGIAIWAVLGVIACYFVIGLVFMAYYAKFYRQMVDGTSLSTLQFEFCARTKDWIKLMLGDVFLTIGTLGIGLIFLNYRHWKFFITHLEASGHIDVNALIQSETAEMKQGEGLLDAFDMGAL